jgi:hypothetical protein
VFHVARRARPSAHWLAASPQRPPHRAHREHGQIAAASASGGALPGPPPRQPAFSAARAAAAARLWKVALGALLAWAAQQRATTAAWAASEGQGALREAMKNASRSVVVAPFAAAAVQAQNQQQLFFMLNHAVYQFVHFYLLVLFIRC